MVCPYCFISFFICFWFGGCFRMWVYSCWNFWYRDIPAVFWCSCTSFLAILFPYCGAVTVWKAFVFMWLLSSITPSQSSSQVL